VRSFSNRERLLGAKVANTFFAEVLARAGSRNLLSTEHFTVDGTLIEAWAVHKSFKRKDGGGERPPDDPGNPTVDFHGERRGNETRQSTTDPEARLAARVRARRPSCLTRGMCCWRIAMAWRSTVA
jgi:hypothetical protein